VAEAHNVSPAQALIRWSLQKGFVCIPKSVSQDRIRQNTDVFGFALTEAEVKAFDALDEFLGAYPVRRDQGLLSTPADRPRPVASD
jgi:2,5-diketo-D-gluconate reductase A